MALDGAFLSRLVQEISLNALDARVDRIFQPGREEILFVLRWRGGSGKLLLSANADTARLQFTNAAFENPKVPLMFCMFLRKHLGNARLVEIRQLGLDRIVHLIFETQNELGDMVKITVAAEIMGRHSNIIVVDQNNRIMESIKHVDEEMSSVRQVLPGMPYILPPRQNKLDPRAASPEEIIARLDGGRDVELAKALMDAVLGVSPIVAREIAHYVNRGEHVPYSALTESQRDKLRFILGRLGDILRSPVGQSDLASPTVVFDTGGKPKDFSFLEIHQYGHSLLTQGCDGYSALLDTFYSERDLAERMRQRSNHLLRLLVTTTERITRKMAVQKEELMQSTQRETLRQYGDLLQTNLYRLEKGMASVRVENFFEEGMPEIDIPLDPALTPSRNAQKYYSDYRKADTAEKKLKELIAQEEEELEYLDSVFDALSRARTEAELNAVRAELADQGYLHDRKNNEKQKPGGKGKKPAKEEKLPPMKYLSADGFTILCGRNNVQNDRLTLKDSRNYDIWLHTQKIPGSHTIIITDGREPPASTIEQAAVIAAYNSKARESTRVAVDYTIVKNVKKPNGAKPGMVIYDKYETAIVTPDEALVNSLRSV